MMKRTRLDRGEEEEPPGEEEEEEQGGGGGGGGDDDDGEAPLLRCKSAEERLSSDSLVFGAFLCGAAEASSSRPVGGAG